MLLTYLAFLSCGETKEKRKKGNGEYQKKHSLLLLPFGGGIGTIAGMYTFRHKTQKIAFVIGFPFITILEIILAIYWIFFK